MAFKRGNRINVATATTGTGTLTLGSPEVGFQSFSEGGVANGDVVAYLIINGTAWETGFGTYTSSGTTLSRDTVQNSSDGGTKISLSGPSTVSVVLTAGDYMGNGDFQGNTPGRILTSDGVWADAGFVTVAYNATLPFDASDWLSAVETVLTGNTTWGDPQNFKGLQHFCWKFTATGGTRTITLHADFKRPTAGVPAFPLSVPITDTVFIYGFYESANVVRITGVQRFT